MPVNPKDKHEDAIKENSERMDAIKKEHPNDYFLNDEWRLLNEKNRVHHFQTQHIENMIKNGVKF